MNIASVKRMVVKGMTIALAAGACMVANPVQAKAQGFAAEVQFGHPYYGRRDFRDFEFERRQEFLRHQEWLRMHRFHGSYGYYR